MGVYSQNIQFERIPNELGLSQNFIAALCQTKDGFIWVGTKDGLNRFDGYHFKTYQHDPADSTSISDNYIKVIFEDQQGRLWVGTTNGLNLFDRKTGKFHRINGPVEVVRPNVPISEHFKGLSHGDINCFVQDFEGNFWMGTMQGGVVKMELPEGSSDLTKAEFTVFTKTEDENSLWDFPVTSMGLAANGDVWVAGFGKTSIIKLGSGSTSYQIQRLYWKDFNPDWKRYSQNDFKYNENGFELKDERFLKLFADGENNIWVMTAGGFGKWDARQGKFEAYDLNINLSDYKVLPLAGVNGSSIFDQNGHIWLTGGYGIVVYDTLTHKILLRNHQHDRTDIGLPPDAGGSSILKDKFGNIWLGTNGKGLYKYSPTIHKFDGQNGTLQWNEGSVRSIIETNDSIIWVGLNNLHLYRINRNTGLGKVIMLDRQRWSRTFEDEFDHIYSMAEDGQGNLWLCGQRGLFKFMLRNGEIEDWNFYEFQDLKALGKVSTVLDIHFDTKGQLWLLTPYEFGRFDPTTGAFDGHNYLEIVKGERLQGGYFCIHQMADETFWLGTHWGLLHYLPKKEKFIFVTGNPQDPNSLSNPVVNCIQADPQEPNRVLWVGTQGGGLNRFDLTKGIFKNYKVEDGLPDNVVYGILSDKEGSLWLSTNQGLSKFNPTSGQFKNYTTKNGLQDNEFNSCAYFKSKNGELLFGGINGFNVFSPESVKDDTIPSNVKFIGLKIANKPMDFKTPNSPLRVPITETQNLTLSWKDKIFSIEFASLDLSAPERNQYAYRLEGFHNDWQYIGAEHSATFTNLNPGHYVFRVKATNHDGVWNEEGAVLKITILPPWWATWWAYLAYALIFAGSVYALYKFQLQRKLEQAEAERLKEMDVLKTQLYTNITHEFRTPLTVIMGMVDNISGHEKERKLIQRNSQNLLRLINQLLDLSKLDAGTMKLDLVRGDIINYLQYLTESFYSMAQERKIKLTFYSEAQQLLMDFDEGKIQHIVFNLLSNALKFTGEGGKVVLHANQVEENDQSFLKLKVQDTGIGIQDEQIHQIFNRFYQADNSLTRRGEGTGIGLALTKELVELMGGNITAQSKLGNGTTFTILLPVRVSAAEQQVSKSLKPVTVDMLPAPKEVSEPVLSQNNGHEDEGKPVLLVIEDNPDVVTYIVGLLEKDYAVLVAKDGQAGIEKALESVPDIIISDVMMPEKDGYEVCETLKNDERTSHIPIILLTAKSEQSDRLIGLRKGADAYLMKPFNKDELLVRLEKLVALRRVLQKKYGDWRLVIGDAGGQVSSLNFGSNEKRDPSQTITSVEPTLEDIFLQKIQKVIEDKMDDTELGIVHLCRAVSLSHTQVFRKLKALTGENPTLYIRKMRLQKAAELLKTADLNISEIAYAVGFSDPNYFSRAFSEEFGAPPSEMRK